MHSNFHEKSQFYASTYIYIWKQVDGYFMDGFLPWMVDEICMKEVQYIKNDFSYIDIYKSSMKFLWNVHEKPSYAFHGQQVDIRISKYQVLQILYVPYTAW